MEPEKNLQTRQETRQETREYSTSKQRVKNQKSDVIARAEKGSVLLYVTTEATQQVRRYFDFAV